jgi:hypothetical protein
MNIPGFTAEGSLEEVIPGLKQIRTHLRAAKPFLHN